MTRRPALRAAIALLGLLAAATTPHLAWSRAPAGAETLPPQVVPSAYELLLHPDAAALTFRGELRITIEAAARSPSITLHAADLVLDRVALDGAPARKIDIDAPRERAVLRFARPVSRGGHVLEIAYHGSIGRTTLGFFAMDRDAATGAGRILATNLEPTFARRLLPCWDEPARKATFSLSVDVSGGALAISNMPVESSETLAPGIERIRFARTPKMSTYLLFLGVGDFERITDDSAGTEIGVVVPRGDGARARYALAEAARLLRYYNDYFGVPYPLPKLDLVAAPGSIDGDAMENWGAILFDQSELLFDDRESTETDRQEVFTTVAHEMAHQWFGDLVTMSWWDQLWLNEGFAQWMQTKVAAELHPEWQARLRAQVESEAGKRADASAATHPIEQPVASASAALQAFDNITYVKSAAVIRMLEWHLGSGAFREGIRAYLRAHAYGNAVSDDLWRALESASSKPVRGIARAYTRQPGLPLVTATTRTEREGSGVMLSEGRFFAEGPGAKARDGTHRSPWTIPLAVQGFDPGSAPAMVILGTGTTRAGHAPVLVNAGQAAYARVLYDREGYAALTTHFAQLPAIDQVGALEDAWAFGRAGYAPVEVSLDLLDAVPADAEAPVWSAALEVLAGLDTALDGLPLQAEFHAYARRRLAPLLANVGWDTRAGEAPARTVLRPDLLEAMGRFGDPDVVAEARRRFAEALAGRGPRAPEARRAAEVIVARHADRATFDALLERAQESADPRLRGARLVSLAVVADPALAARLLEAALAPGLSPGEQPNLLAAIGREHPAEAWDFTLAHLASARLDLDDQARMQVVPQLLATSSDPRRIAELDDYGRKFLAADSRQQVAGAISEIRQNAALRARSAPAIEAWMAHKVAAAN